MKTFRAFLLSALPLLVLATGCADGGGIEYALEDPGLPVAEQQRVHNAWRVDMIVRSDISNDILAEYTYDEMNRLTRSNLTDYMKGDRIVDRRWDNRFEWRNGLMVKQIEYSQYRDHTFGDDFDYTAETAYEYDSEGRLTPWGNDNWYGNRDYKYDDRGRLIQTYSYEFEGMMYDDRLEWDDRGNVIKHILAGPEYTMFETAIPGTYRESVIEYEYDNHPKPNFGLGDSFFWDGRFSPWPLAGTSLEQMARILSRNNLTRCEQSGIAYRYTYNDDGLPATVQTIWLGIETVEPMMQTIVYKKVAE